MKVTIFILTCIFFILIFPTANALIINEILPNPEEYSDAEWLEIFSEETLNLSGLKLDTTGQIYTFNNTVIENYIIIAKNKTSFLLLWPDVSQEKIIEWGGMGLNNAGEPVSLLNNSIIVDTTTYPSFSSNAGKSWARLSNGTFVVCDNPTPLSENNCSQGGNEPPQQQESEIRITDSPNDARFGEEIEVEVEIYRGNTSKYAVYVYVEKEDGEDVSEKISFHCDEKFQNYTETFNLELDCENEEGDYIIVAEGLDERDEEYIEINICEEYENSNQEENGTNGEESEGVTIGDFTYALTIPNTIYISQDFSLQVRITSQAEQDQEFLVWSYVYLASKCYSCTDTITRESNAKSIIVPSGDSAEVSLMNVVESDSAEPGIYKLKVKILQQGLKTPKEFTYNITLESSSLSQTTAQQSQQSQQSSSALPPSTYAAYSSNTNTVESENFSFIKIGPYILVSLALLAAIYLIITKI